MPLRSSLSPLLLPAVGAALLAACGSSTSSNGPSPDVRIVANAETKGFQAYSPDTISVSLSTDGGRVTFRNDDGTTHTVTDTTAAALFSKTLGAGQTASLTFASTGSFPFKCSIHPGMRGLIQVTP